MKEMKIRQQLQAGIMSILCAALILLLLWPFTEVNAEDEYVYYSEGMNGGELIFNKSNGMITGSSNCSGEIVIPDSIEGVAVSVIGSSAFSDSDITGISLPQSIRTIGNSAFSRSALKAVEIPESVTNVGDYAFSGCNLLKSVSFSTNCTGIGERVFEYCESLETITIPDSIRIISEGAFCGCKALTEVLLPESVVSINKYVFSECIGLKKVVIMNDNIRFEGTEDIFPDNDGFALYGTPGSTTQEYANTNNIKFRSSDPDNPATQESGEINNAITWELLDNGLLRIQGNGAMPDYDSGAMTPWYGVVEDIRSVTVGEGITSIGDYAFYGAINMTAVTLPSTVKAINGWSFERCKSLKTIQFPDGLEEININAFKDCSSLTAADMPDGLTYIGMEAFKGCKSLKRVYVPGTVTEFGKDIFFNCNSLKSAGPGGSGCDYEFEWKKSIPSRAFCGCCGIERIILPKGITSIGEYAFAYTGIKEIDWPEAITDVPDGTFCRSSIETFDFSKIKGVGESAFCESCIKSFDSKGCTVLIENNAFENCNYLTSVKLNKNMQIQKEAFAYCHNLHQVIIPDGGTIEIDDYAFGGAYIEIIASNGSPGQQYAERFGIPFINANSSDKTPAINQWGPIDEIATFDETSAAITSDGKLWMWGRNDYNQLGTGAIRIDDENPSIYRFHNTADKVKHVYLGEKYNCFLKEDGTLWMCGDYGGICTLNGGYISGSPEKPVCVMENVKDYDPSSEIVVTTDGKAYLLRDDPYTGAAEYIADNIIDVHGQYILNESGELFRVGFSNDKELLSVKRVLENVRSFSARYDKVLAVTSDQTLWLYEESFPNIKEKVMDDVVSASLGTSHYAAIKSDGSLWMWGDNSSGQLGIASNQVFEDEIIDRSKATSQGSFSLLTTDSSGNVVKSTVPLSVEEPVKVMDHVTKVSAGDKNTLILADDGSLYECGYNCLEERDYIGFRRMASFTEDYAFKPVRISKIPGDEQIPEADENNRNYKYYSSKSKYLSQKSFQTSLKNLLTSNMNEDRSFAIPGIIETKYLSSSGRESWFDYVPQGLCKFGDYYLATAYAEVPEGKKQRPSVVYVMDPSWNHIKTITIGDYSYHNGGITYDADSDVLWLCGQTGEKNQQSFFVYALKGDKIRNAINNTDKEVHIDSFSTEEIPVNNAASCLDYHDGRLWVGTWSNTTSKIVGYKTTGTKLNRKKPILLTGERYLNGFIFDDLGNLYCSYSFKRHFHGTSKVVKYEPPGDDFVLKELKSVDVPRMNEEILIDNGYMYIMYESGADKYRNAYHKTDRFTALPISLWDTGKALSRAKSRQSSPIVFTELIAGEERTASFDSTDDEQEVNRTYMFTPEDTGSYSIAISDFSADDNAFLSAEVVEGDTCKGTISTAEYNPAAENGNDLFSVASYTELTLNLTGGTPYYIYVSPGSLDNTEAYTGSYSLSARKVGGITAVELTEAVEKEGTVALGEQSCFAFTPEETGKYAVDWSSDGELGEVQILENLETEVPYNGKTCYLEKGKTYYFTSFLNDTEGIGNTGTVSLKLTKLEETKLTEEAGIQIKSNSSLEYEATETRAYIVEADGAEETIVEIYDSNGTLVAIGSGSAVFTAEKGSNYSILCSNIEDGVTVSIKTYDPDQPEGGEESGTPAQDGPSGGSADPAKTQPQTQQTAQPTEIVDLPKVKISKPKAAKKAVTVKWKKLSKKNKKKVSKIQIQISKDRKFTEIVKQKYASAKKTSLKVKGLKKKKTYYVRIRSFKVINGKVHVSKWSSVKKFKTK